MPAAANIPASTEYANCPSPVASRLLRLGLTRQWVWSRGSITRNARSSSMLMSVP